MRSRNKSQITAGYRTAFLEAIDNLAPSVVEELRALAPSYQEALARFSPEQRFTLAEWWSDDASIGMLVGDGRSSALDVFASLGEILSKHGLKTKWLRSHVCGFLEMPHQRFVNGVSGQDESFELPFTFQFDNWDISAESNADYRGRIRHAFDEYLSRYLNESIAVAKQQGYWLDTRGVTDKRTQDVETAVRWTVLEWEKGDIIEAEDKASGNDNGREESSIEKRLRRCRDHGIPVREKKRGRKKAEI